MMTIEDYLKRNAELWPDKVAVVCGDEICTYRQLYDRMCLRASLLHVTGRLMPFRTSQTIDFLVTYFAIHHVGGVAVPLEQGMPDELFALHQQRMKGVSVSAGTADVLFTTGTTGQSKGVVISHSAIIADAENLVEAQGYHRDLTFIICGPLNHIGSLSKVYPMLLVGGTLRILEGTKDLNAFFLSIDEAKGKVGTFLVPASIRMLLAFSANRLGTYADRIEMIETGAAPMAQTDMEQLCSLLPHTRLFNTYASTETGIIATYDYNLGGECQSGCLGKPMRHSSIEVAADGHIVCCGKTLMSGYLGDESLTREVLHDGAIHTADLGYIDSLRRLHLTGRRGDVINVGGYKVVPTEVEDAALSTGLVADCVCVAAHHRVLGIALKLLVVLPEGMSFDKRQIALALKSRLESYKVPMLYEQVEAVRRTYNGKIDRKAYR